MMMATREPPSFAGFMWASMCWKKRSWPSEMRAAPKRPDFADFELVDVAA